VVTLADNSPTRSRTGSTGDQPIPPTIIGIAEVTACLTGLVISSQGFVFPGTISVARAGTSFQDLQGMRRLPRPDFP
jgi:hypothetical protein